MDVSAYILSIVCAAIVCAVVKILLNKHNGSGLLIKFILGVFLTATVAAPLRTLEFAGIDSYGEDFRQQAERAAQEGKESTGKQLEQLIKEKSEAYVLDKAVSLGLEIEVEVTLSSSDPPTPKSATIKGTVSPYAKVKLAEYITAGLDVQRDEIIWI